MSSGISRRGFVAATAAALAALCATGCSKTPQSEPENVLEEVKLTQKIDWDSGRWISAACVHGCGNKCVNKAYVVDGVVLCQQSDGSREDVPEMPLKKPCLRGLSQRKRVFGTGRLKYPMKRKGWEPLTGGDKSLRGRDEWERISWEEALDYVAAEFKNAREVYGDKSILLCDNLYAGQDDFGRLLANTGGFVHHWWTGSYGSYTTAFLYGFRQNGAFHNMVNDRMDLRNCELIVMIGMNPAWNNCGNTLRYYMEAKANGAEFVSVDPFFNDTANLYDAEWIPVRPGTDVAFLLGVAHEVLALDATVGNMIDWDFLDKCTLGFDEREKNGWAKARAALWRAGAAD